MILFGFKENIMGEHRVSIYNEELFFIYFNAENTFKTYI